ncbi:hypothetical protein D9M71_289280 [compost metagenome]
MAVEQDAGAVPVAEALELVQGLRGVFQATIECRDPRALAPYRAENARQAAFPADLLQTGEIIPPRRPIAAQPGNTRQQQVNDDWRIRRPAVLHVGQVLAEQCFGLVQRIALVERHSTDDVAHEPAAEQLAAGIAPVLRAEILQAEQRAAEAPLDQVDDAFDGHRNASHEARAALRSVTDGLRQQPSRLVDTAGREQAVGQRIGQRPVGETLAGRDLAIQLEAQFTGLLHSIGHRQHHATDQIAVQLRRGTLHQPQRFSIAPPQSQGPGISQHEPGMLVEHIHRNLLQPAQQQARAPTFEQRGEVLRQPLGSGTDIAGT